MSAGTGIAITFNGNSNPAEIALLYDNSTVGVGGSGLEVKKVPNALSAGNGILAFTFDGSATKTVAVNNAIVATLTGSQFTGDVRITGSLEVKAGLSGSLTRLADGTAYLREGNNVSITSASDGSITISSTGGGGGGGSGDPNASYLVLATTGSLTNERVLTAGTGLYRVDGGAGSSWVLNIDNSVVATLTGSVFSGDVVAQTGLSGSLQMLSNGTKRYMVGGGGVTVSTASDGQLTISGSVGKTYSAGTGLQLTNDTFAVNNAIVATLTGSVFSGDVVASSGLSGSLQMLANGTTPYLWGTGSVTVSTSSSGQLVISASDASSNVTQAGGSTTTNVTTFIFTGSTVADSGGGTVTVAPVIGAAEDSSYSDGLFTDFAYTTPIGTAIDRFNEVLKGLAPAAAPSLDDMNCADSGTAAVLSFGSSQSISGYTNAQPSTLTPTDNLSDININGTFSSTTVSNDVRVACFEIALCHRNLFQLSTTVLGKLKRRHYTSLVLLRLQATLFWMDPFL
jgi:hypothetical protein